MRTSGAQEFRDEVAVIRKARPLAGENLDFPVIRYTGASSNPQWMDEEIGRRINPMFSSDNCISEVITEEYETISHIRVDLGRVPYILAITASGLVSVQEFEVIYIYGDTAQIKAQVAWKDGVCLPDSSYVLRLTFLSHNLPSFLQGKEKRYAPLVLTRRPCD